MSLIRVEPSITDAIAYMQTVLNDQDAPIDERGQAAHNLAKLDRSQWRRGVATLRRLLVQSQGTLDEQVELIGWLRKLRAFRQEEINRFNLAVVHHPSVSAPTRRRALDHVTDEARDGLLHDIVSDATIAAAVRISRHNDAVPAQVVSAVARDVLDAIESTRADRVAAAAALAGSAPEAVAVLIQLASCRDTRFRSWRVLAGLGSTHKRQVMTDAMRLIADEAAPLHSRLRSCELITRHLCPLPAPALDFLHQVASAARTSTRQRLDARFHLRHIHGLDGIRSIRDDERTSAAARWYACTLLINYRPEDRVKGAEILRSIAADTVQQPALRCAAAADLLRFGASGRAEAAEIAHAMAVDTKLPSTSRVRAAEVLAKAARSRRPEVLTILDELSTADNPLHRLRALETMATLAPLRATPLIHAMTRDRELPPVARLRCAEALVQTHRHHHESAVIAARDVAFNQHVPRHVRVHAAQNLARWSEAFRDDARQLLHTLLADRGTRNPS